MKKRDWIKVLVLVLTIAFIIPCFTSCAAGTKVLTLKADNGKTYIINKEQFDFLMCYTKANFFMNQTLPSSYDIPSYLWEQKIGSDSEQTVDDYYKQLVVNQLKGVLVEEYLFDKYNLKLNDEEVAAQKKSVQQTVTNLGGTGSYKQYWGYRWQMLYEHSLASLRSTAIMEYLYGENGVDKVTSEELDQYYQDNFYGYYVIKFDMTHKVETDEEGNKIRKTTTDSEGVETETDEYSLVELTDEEKEEKALLPQILIYQLEDDADFQELAIAYSDDYISVKYPNGLYITEAQLSNYLSDSTALSAAKALEIGEYTQPISISDGKYTYIIKRVELREKAYEDEEYADLFKDYEETVKYDKYDDLIENYVELIESNDAVIEKASMANTFLTEYVDYYYQLAKQYSS
ncbi:MAG: hypothetical protein K6F14_06615 [Clostridiales bacterium]|nr:hypothetical protein [Clostridiales bacterium]